MADPKLYFKRERPSDFVIQTVRVLRKDIGMQFGIDKCAMLVMKNGKTVKSDGIKLPNGKLIRSLEEGKN